MGHGLGDARGGVRIFFATDIHGSEVCWRKFLNAGAFHKADVLIMGGDMTGKAMVPIVASERRLGGRRPGAAPRPVDGGRGPGDGEADRRPRLLPGPPVARRGRRLGGRPGARRRPVQGGDAGGGRALDGAGRRATRRNRASAASSRRPTTTSSRSTRSSTAAERVELGEANTIDARRVLARVDRLGQPDAVEHVPRAARARAPGADRRARRARSPTRTGRSSTSMRRRTARTLTTRRSSTQT